MRKATKIGFIAVFCAAVGLTFPVFNIFSNIGHRKQPKKQH